MQAFREVIDEFSFMDLGYIGPDFTWSKHYTYGHSIWERLDRGLATNQWFMKFPGTWVYHLPCLSSDHCPLLINPTGIDFPSYKKPFQFEEMWLLDSSCGKVVDVAWRSCVARDSDSEIIRKIDKCGKDLSWWNYNVFGNVRRELKKKRDLLIEEEAVAVRTGNNFRIKALKDEIKVLMDREARMWNQRSRILWLKNGDGNTKFSILVHLTGLGKMLSWVLMIHMGVRRWSRMRLEGSSSISTRNFSQPLIRHYTRRSWIKFHNLSWQSRINVQV